MRNLWLLYSTQFSRTIFFICHFADNDKVNEGVTGTDLRKKVLVSTKMCHLMWNPSVHHHVVREPPPPLSIRPCLNWMNPFHVVMRSFVAISF
jgi:hypothetical protein